MIGPSRVLELFDFPAIRISHLKEGLKVMPKTIKNHRKKLQLDNSKLAHASLNRILEFQNS